MNGNYDGPEGVTDLGPDRTEEEEMANLRGTGKSGFDSLCQKIRESVYSNAADMGIDTVARKILLLANDTDITDDPLEFAEWYVNNQLTEDVMARIIELDEQCNLFQEALGKEVDEHKERMKHEWVEGWNAD